MDMYGELILDHSKRPVGAGLREGFGAEVHHINPTCGDEVTLRVHLGDSDGVAVLSDLSYDALGCSISMASTSILAQECVGEPVSDTLMTYGHVKAMLTSRGADPGEAEEIGDAVALAGVAKYPARVKCALLGWTAYLDALAQAGYDISAIAAASPSPSHPSTMRS
ncbi:MAG: SUF system NifU family Fe-S cluster assembly protein [Ornithinimicrobium sp.]